MKKKKNLFATMRGVTIYYLYITYNYLQLYYNIIYSYVYVGRYAVKN